MLRSSAASVLRAAIFVRRPAGLRETGRHVPRERRGAVADCNLPRAAVPRSVGFMPRRCAGLLLFVYVDIGGYGARPLVDGDGDEFLPNPLSLRRLPDLLDAAGWRLQPRRPLLTEY